MAAEGEGDDQSSLGMDSEATEAVLVKPRSVGLILFDSVPWDLMLKAVARHTDQKWVLLYVERWLKAPMQRPDGTLVPRVKGTPQGSLCAAAHNDPYE